ncbi:MAG: WD40 repeat domain-containing protein, partial [Thermoanaerobaculia bacterium]
VDGVGVTLDFSLDGRRAAVALGDSSISLRDARSGEEWKRLPQRLPPNSLRFSPSGEALAVPGRHSAAVPLIEAGTGRVRKSFRHTDIVHDAAFSPDGAHLATASSSGRVYVWDVERGELQSTLEGHRGSAVSVAFTPDGRWLVTSIGAEYRFWEPGRWESHHLVQREGAGDTTGPMAFTGDGKLMALARSRSLVELVDPATGRSVARLEAPSSKGANDLAFSPSGARLAVVIGLGWIQLWDLRRIRERLAEVGLDWELPSLPARAPGVEPGPSASMWTSATCPAGSPPSRRSPSRRLAAR